MCWILRAAYPEIGRATDAPQLRQNFVPSTGDPQSPQKRGGSEREMDSGTGAEGDAAGALRGGAAARARASAQ